jgi:hypothetical protein
MAVGLFGADIVQGTHAYYVLIRNEQEIGSAIGGAEYMGGWIVHTYPVGVDKRRGIKVGVDCTLKVGYAYHGEGTGVVIVSGDDQRIPGST